MIIVNGDKAIEEVVRDLLLGIGQTPNRATVRYLTMEIAAIVEYSVKHALDLLENTEISAPEKKSGYLYGVCGHHINSVGR